MYDKGTYFDNFGPRQRLPCLDCIVGAMPRVKLLPLLLEVVHGLLLFLACCCCMESHEITSRVQLETLRAKFRVNTDENHGW